MQDKLPPENEKIEDNGTDFVDENDDQAIVQISGDSIGSSYSGVKKRKVYAGIWGPFEIAAVAIGSALLLLSILFYLGLVVPAQSEQANGRRQRDDLDRELTLAREKWGSVKSTETQVAKLVTSAEDFENRSLKDESIGTSAVYQRVNVLIKSYGLRNTSGPDYVPLTSSDNGERKQAGGGGKRGRDKYKSLFPGIYITTTVEGAYPNIRRFIREIETSSEFVAITSLEIEPADDQKSQAETETMEIKDANGRKIEKSFRKGRFRGNVVSLRIEMAAYFRRPAEQRLNTAQVEKSEETTNATD
jgi:hypothetical protein